MPKQSNGTHYRRRSDMARSTADSSGTRRAGAAPLDRVSTGSGSRMAAAGRARLLAGAARRAVTGVGAANAPPPLPPLVVNGSGALRCAPRATVPVPLV